MGLSSKQVSSKRPSMKRQTHEQQDCEPLKCPRCDSTNTKFCYFNNYNESQPRHYCRACKRHWTKGGSLRNVPVGGGRKNRRIKKNTASPTVASATATNANTRRSTTPTISSSNLTAHMAIQNSVQIQNLPLVPDGQKNFLYQPLTHQAPLLLQHDSTNYTCALDDKFSVGAKNGLPMGTTAMTLPVQLQTHCLQFPFSSSSNSDTHLSSITTAFQPSNVYDHGDEFKTIDEPAITSMITQSTCGNHTQPWQVPILDNGMDITSSWNWDDIDSLVSIDLSTSWKDTDLKP